MTTKKQTINDVIKNIENENEITSDDIGMVVKWLHELSNLKSMAETMRDPDIINTADMQKEFKKAYEEMKKRAHFRAVLSKKFPEKLIFDSVDIFFETCSTAEEAVINSIEFLSEYVKKPNLTKYEENMVKRIISVLASEGVDTSSII